MMGALRRWAGRREAHRLMLGAGVLALAMLLAGLLLGLGLSRSVASGYAQTLLELRVEQAAGTARQRLQRVHGELGDLAASSFVVNALSDSLGRDAYLGPYLRQHPLRNLGVRLTVCNASDEVIGQEPRGSRQDGASDDCGAPAEVANLLAGGRAVADLRAADDEMPRALRLRVPVRFPLTGTHEGLVVAVLPLTRVLEGSEAGLQVAGEAVEAAPAGPDGNVLRLQRGLGLEPAHPAAGLPLQVEVALPPGSARLDLRPILLAYGAASLLLAALAVAVAARLAQRWTRPLRELTALAAASATGRRGPLPPQLDTPNELGELARALQRMGDDLVAANERLSHQVDELAQARDAAERSGQAKAQFLAMMSHEIRTPMNAVMGLLAVALHGPLDAAQRERLQRAHRSAQGLLGVINDVLDYSKIDSGRLDIERQPFRPQELLATVADVVQQAAQEKGLALHVELDPALPPRLLGDELRLRQVLINLAGNAVKFTERGHVRLRLDCAAGCNGNGPSELRALVEDTGIGLSAEQQAALFQPFVQVDSSARRRFSGTGLGLAISRRLVELMGGRLSVKSLPGQGSCFSFVVPLMPVPDAQPDGPETDDGGTLPPALVLVVDDNEVNRLVASEMLRLLGLQVVQAEDGAKALAALEREPGIAAVLLDCHMPVMDGYETARRVRAVPRWRGLPLIALTADVTEGERQACLDAGMNTHLGKPIQLDGLRTALRRWLPAADAAGAAARAEGLPPA